jgi:hypothetical protein
VLLSTEICSHDESEQIEEVNKGSKWAVKTACRGIAREAADQPMNVRVAPETARKEQARSTWSNNDSGST